MKGKNIFFAASCLAMFAVSFANATQGMMLTSFINFYGLESAAQGLASTFMSIGSLLSVFILLLFTGRMKKPSMIFWLTACVVVSMFGIGFAPPFVALLLLYMVFGIALCGLSTVTSSVAAELYRGSNANMGLLHAMFGAGGLVGPLVLDALMRSAGMSWNNAFFVVAGLALISLLFCGFANVRYGRRLQFVDDDSVKFRMRDIAGYFKSRRNTLLIISSMGYSAFQNGLYTWVARYVADYLGAIEIGALTLSLYWVGTTLARLTLSRMKVSPVKMLAWGNLISAVLFAGGALTLNPVLMLIGTTAAGFASGPAIPMYSHVGSVWHPQNTLFANNLQALVRALIWIATAPLFALSMDMGMEVGMCVIALFALIGFFTLLPIFNEKTEVEA